MRLFGFVNNIFPKNDKEKMTENILEIAKHCEDRFEPKSQHHKKNRIVWVTQFSKLLQLSNQEKKLKPKAAIVCRNPPDISY